MSDHEYGSAALWNVGRELDAATAHTAINAAVKRVMRAKAELKRLQTRGASLVQRGVHDMPLQTREPRAKPWLSRATCSGFGADGWGMKVKST
jgi:hypothetical protein